MTASISELNLLMFHYTGGSKSKLDYDDFLKMILPYETMLKFSSTSKFVHYSPNETELNPKFETALVEFIKAEISINNNIEKRKQILRRQPDFNLSSIYLILSTVDNGISEENIKKLLHTNCYENSAKLFVRRYDLDKDGILSYEEFAEGILPSYTSTNINEDVMKSNIEFININRNNANSSQYKSKIRIENNMKPIYNMLMSGSLSHSPSTKEYKSIKKQRMFSEERIINDELRNNVLYCEKKPMKNTFYDKFSLLNKIRSPKKAFNRQKEINANEVNQDINTEEFEFIIKQQINADKILEELKNELIIQPEFNYISAFRLFETKGNCYVTLTDFQEGLENLGICQDTDDISILYHRYNKGSKDRLKYADFCEMISPVSKVHLHILSRRKNINTKLSEHSISMIKQVLEKSIEIETKLETLKKTSNINAHKLFKILDTKNKREISLNDVYLQIIIDKTIPKENNNDGISIAIKMFIEQI